MLEFSLNLNIPDVDLPVLLDAGLNITLAKQVEGSANVAWQVFRPFPTNTVTWEETYGIYASNTIFSNNVKIAQISAQNPAVDNLIYPFTEANIFGPSSPGKGQGIYSITNQNNSVPALTFGLTQGATVNSTATGFKPLNAQTVPQQLHADFTPLTTVYVWVQSNIVSETMITEVASTATKVVFGGDVTTQDLLWDASRGAFVPNEGTTIQMTTDRSVYELGNGITLLAPMIL